MMPGSDHRMMFPSTSVMIPAFSSRSHFENSGPAGKHSFNSCSSSATTCDLPHFNFSTYASAAQGNFSAGHIMQNFHFDHILKSRTLVFEGRSGDMHDVIDIVQHVGRHHLRDIQLPVVDRYPGHKMFELGLCISCHITARFME